MLRQRHMAISSICFIVNEEQSLRPTDIENINLYLLDSYNSIKRVSFRISLQKQRFIVAPINVTQLYSHLPLPLSPCRMRPQPHDRLGRVYALALKIWVLITICDISITIFALYGV